MTYFSELGEQLMLGRHPPQSSTAFSSYKMLLDCYFEVQSSIYG